jgi:hypothetical protein
MKVKLENFKGVPNKPYKQTMKEQKNDQIIVRIFLTILIYI